MRKLSSGDTARRIHKRIMADPHARRGYETQQAIVWLGQMFRNARKARRESQEAIAKRAGMSQSELSRLENGLPVKGVTFRTLLALSSALDMNIVFEAPAGAARSKTQKLAVDAPQVPHLMLRQVAG